MFPEAASQKAKQVFSQGPLSSISTIWKDFVHQPVSVASIKLLSRSGEVAQSVMALGFSDARTLGISFGSYLEQELQRVSFLQTCRVCLWAAD